jgi:hypothetical protein
MSRPGLKPDNPGKSMIKYGIILEAFPLTYLSENDKKRRFNMENIRLMPSALERMKKSSKAYTLYLAARGG